MESDAREISPCSPQDVLNEWDVGEVDGCIDTHNHHPLGRDGVRVLLQVAVHGRPGEPPQDCGVRVGRLVDHESQGQDDRHQDAGFDAEEERAQEGEHPQQEILRGRVVSLKSVHRNDSANEPYISQGKKTRSSRTTAG